MSSAALPFPLETKKRVTNLDALLHAPLFERAAPVSEELAAATVPLPGMFTALRVCLFVNGGLLLAGAVAYETLRASH